MSQTTKLGLVALALTGLLNGTAAQAQSASCGIIGSATATPAFYDPFNPTGLAVNNIQLNLTRVNGAGGQKTNIVNFYLKAQSSGADGTIIIPTMVAVEGSSSGTGNNIFYNFSAAPPVVAPTSVSPTTANRFLKIEFTGNNAASDNAVVTFNVSLPANLDVNAITSLSFDAIFACSTTGGGGPTQQTGSIPNAVRFPVTVLSALQASYVGSALDFGEVGDKTNADVTGAPAAFTRSGDIRVASSGPYNVTMTSTNNYRLTFPGGNPATPMQSLTYSATLLGNTRSGTSGNTTAVPAITKTCARAGVGGLLLPVTARLTEGGASKTPAPLYSDTLNLTIAPQVATVIGMPCP